MDNWGEKMFDTLKNKKRLNNTTVEDILQHIYDSEIHLSIGWMWDGGVDYKIGADLYYLKGEICRTDNDDIGSAVMEIANEIVIKYPKSSFAQWFDHIKKNGHDDNAHDTDITKPPVFNTYAPTTKIVVEVYDKKLMDLYTTKLESQLSESKERLQSMQNSLDKLYANNQSLSAEVERLRDIFGELKDWCNAYPDDIFPEPDWKGVRYTLESNGLRLDDVSASNMRHVLTGIKEKVEQALNTEV